MKIGITADVHLKNRETTPERFNALDDILKQLKRENINRLIIAGDLFDKEYRNYKDFDNLCKKYQDINFYIIPGNHDQDISEKIFASGNIQVFTEPTIFQFSESKSVKFLFIPYKNDKAMGEIMEEQRKLLLPHLWVLIGHGNYLAGKMPENKYEEGIYMPLSRADIQEYQPARVILGHIHKPIDIDKKVHYPGSPSSLDITETGRRRYLILDIDSLELISLFVNTEHIYFNETLIVIPVENESDYIKEQAEKIISRWGIKEEEKTKVKLRIKAEGATSNKNKLAEIIKDAFYGIKFYDEPDINEVNVVDRNSEKISILERVKQKVEEQVWEKNTLTKEKVLIEAIKTIFGIE